MSKTRVLLLVFLFLSFIGTACGKSDTPTLSGTPAPSFRDSTLDPDCNPFWNLSRQAELDVVSTVEDAQQILFTEITRWTRLAQLKNDPNQIYLTYLSPQVIEAIVMYTGIQQGLSETERRNLLMDFDRRLQLNNSMAFLMLIRLEDRAAAIPIEIEPFEQTLALVNQRGERFSPYSEYTRSLIEDPDVRGSSAQGYILFPRSVGEGCNPTINLLGDHSFDVRLEGAHYPITKLDPFLWSFTLLPNIPLGEAMNIPTTSDSPQLDLGTLNDILGLALTIFQILTIK